jgi:hypothetical protein
MGAPAGVASLLGGGPRPGLSHPAALLTSKRSTFTPLRVRCLARLRWGTIVRWLHHIAFDADGYDAGFWEGWDLRRGRGIGDCDADAEDVGLLPPPLPVLNLLPSAFPIYHPTCCLVEVLTETMMACLPLNVAANLRRRRGGEEGCEGTERFGGGWAGEGEGVRAGDGAPRSATFLYTRLSGTSLLQVQHNQDKCR